MLVRIAVTTAHSGGSSRFPKFGSVAMNALKGEVVGANVGQRSLSSSSHVENQQTTDNHEKLTWFRKVKAFARVPMALKRVPITLSNSTNSHHHGKRLLPHHRHAVRVVTDIDDTVVSSGGVKLFGIPLGGIDNLYKRGLFYPGATQFAFELSNHPQANPAVGLGANDSSNSIANVAVLTARAREFKFALALKPTGKLPTAYRKTGHRHGEGEWGIGDVYYGSVMEWILQGRKGIRKLKNFERMMEEDDKRDGHHVYRKYIFIGDTGEKDEEAAERAAAKHPERMSAVFLHQVFDFRNKHNIEPRSDRTVNGVPFHYFRTYIGAGIKAFKNNLISKDALTRITSQSVQDLHAMDVQISKIPKSKFWRSPWHDFQHNRWEEIKDDVKECSFLLPLLIEPASHMPAASRTQHGHSHDHAHPSHPGHSHHSHTRDHSSGHSHGHSFH